MLLLNKVNSGYYYAEEGSNDGWIFPYDKEKYKNIWKEQRTERVITKIFLFPYILKAKLKKGGRITWLRGTYPTDIHLKELRCLQS